MAYNVKWSRNLQKGQLGGVIFGCTDSTIEECHTRQLFGLPSRHISYVQNIEPGLPLFLFNYSRRKLLGIYEAASSGKMNIDPYAWTEGGLEHTRYPAQVMIRVRRKCQELAEVEFKPIIIDNYYGQAHFLFELSHAQANILISKFSSLAVSSSFSRNPRPQWRMPRESKLNRASEAPSLVDEFSGSSDSIGNDLIMESSMQNDITPCEKKDFLYMKLEELALSHEYSDAERMGCEVEAKSTDDIDLVCETHDCAMVTLAENNDESPLIGSVDCTATIVESESNPRVPFDEENSVKSPASFESNLSQSIYIVGGYNGVTWLSDFDSFSPSQDVLTSLKPMSLARSYASVATFEGELYAFGGGAGSLWYDSVESYNAAKNEWTTRPSLKEKRGSLASAALNGKLFAIGGGNGIECFSKVEMYDPYIGRWIFAHSMLEKRFALGGVELNGAIYAVGGYDGNDYLKSAERFDPREHSWGRIAKMNTKRGCHSLVAMNEKLYAIGGYDGTTMVPSVEIYDPRLNTWTIGERMHQARGYLAALVLDETILCAIGGVKAEDGDIADKIEVYKEAQGWEVTNLKAVGKRAFASAVVVKD